MNASFPAVEVQETVPGSCPQALLALGVLGAGGLVGRPLFEGRISHQALNCACGQQPPAVVEIGDRNPL